MEKMTTEKRITNSKNRMQRTAYRRWSLEIRNRMSAWRLRYVLFGMLFFMTTVAVDAQSPDRTKPPELGPTPSLTINPVKKFTLKNGLDVYVYWQMFHKGGER